MMITRCPACATTFRVTPEQLKAQHGKVRCGQCQHVFNALDTLLDAVAAPIESIEPIEPIDLQLEFPLMEEAAAETSEQFAENPELSAEAATEDSELAQEPVTQPQEIRAKPSSLRAWTWALAATLALLALLLQMLMQFRVELSVLLPQAKPALQVLCETFGCDVPLPRKADLVSIESSDLNPDQKGLLVLAATLKNRAPFVQAYPHLELTLTDTADRPLLRKVLPPSDYLPKGIDKSLGFPANGDLTVNLTLQHDHADDVAAAGYRLYLFYP